ncbi:DUF433 domain-containing protein [Phytohabitans rumicis]|uniref:DUF433 domain-containing protein n=1 Tax=Phytohabitans rumicis TaxID=1076125 RepID=UPI00156529B4|nr:DUF433 domain-containing protein [Phytohabitans rumicis]
MVSVLDREMYSEAEAARLLGVPQSTLHYWLEGGERRGRRYRPVIRPEPRRTRIVTWAEFVEAGWLLQYRNRNVPMVELRAFIDQLRDQFGVPYPLADRRPLVSGRQLVFDAQSAVQLGAEFCLVSVVNGQLLLTPPGQAFVERIEWDGDIAIRYRPDPNPDSPVRIEPDVRFGRPAIKGISTEAIWEQAEVGEETDQIAQVYGLDVADVRWALAYENAKSAKRAA